MLLNIHKSIPSKVIYIKQIKSKTITYRKKGDRARLDGYTCSFTLVNGLIKAPQTSPILDRLQIALKMTIVSLIFIFF